MTHMIEHARAADGTRLAYQRHGAGRPLVLLAGQANNHTWWDNVRADFDGTLTLDYRGTGDSDKPDLPYSTQVFADDVIAVLDEIGADEVDLYGTSMGGRVAQWVAARHPHRVRRLILGCTSPGGEHGVERTNEVRRTLAQADAVKAREALADMMYTPQWRAEHPGPYLTLGDPNMPPHAVRGHLVASNTHDAWDVLRNAGRWRARSCATSFTTPHRRSAVQGRSGAGTRTAAAARAAGPHPSARPRSSPRRHGPTADRLR